MQRPVLSLLVVAVLLLPATGALAEVNPRVLGAPGAPLEGAPMTIATGPDNTVDGYLEIGADEYGSWGSFGLGGPYTELFNPATPDLDLLEASFTSGFFLFVPALGQRELLSDNGDWQAVFAPDSSLERLVLSANVASDTNSDGVNDTLTSSFGVQGGGTALLFDLTQSVAALGGSVATMTQEYTVTNMGSSMVSFDLVRAYDGDMVWSGDFSNDEVGTSQLADGVGPFVFEQEVVPPGVTAVTVSGSGAGDYYGGKNGVQPEGGPPPYGFGTDVQVWDAFGVPTSWRNHIAGVGYDTDGLSGPAPPGSIDPEDGFIGLDFSLTLAPDASTTITVVHTYGSSGPRDGLTASIDGSCPGAAFFTVTGGSAGGGAGILRGAGPGNDPLPAGPCAGEISGLTSPSVVSFTTLDDLGGLVLNPSLTSAPCGGFLQVVDAESCALSNVIQIPD